MQLVCCTSTTSVISTLKVGTYALNNLLACYKHNTCPNYVNGMDPCLHTWHGSTCPRTILAYPSLCNFRSNPLCRYTIGICMDPVTSQNSVDIEPQIQIQNFIAIVWYQTPPTTRTFGVPYKIKHDPTCKVAKHGALTVCASETAAWQMHHHGPT